MEDMFLRTLVVLDLRSYSTAAVTLDLAHPLNLFAMAVTVCKSLVFYFDF